MGTMTCAFITDVLVSDIIGAFLFGLILPHGRFISAVMSAADNFVSGILAPVLFAGSGARMDLTNALSARSWYFSVMIIILLSIPKILSTLVATFAYGIPVRDGLGLGVLMNTKGVMALIMLNLGWVRQVHIILRFDL